MGWWLRVSHEDPLPDIHVLSRVTHLELYGVQSLEIVIENLVQCNCIVSLTILRSPIRVAHVRRLGRLKTLTALCLGDLTGNLEDLIFPATLEELDLRRIAVSSLRGALEAAGLHLTMLSLVKCELQDEDWFLIKSMPALRRLGLFDCQVNGKLLTLMKESELGELVVDGESFGQSD